MFCIPGAVTEAGMTLALQLAGCVTLISVMMAVTAGAVAVTVFLIRRILDPSQMD